MTTVISSTQEPSVYTPRGFNVRTSLFGDLPNLPGAVCKSREHDPNLWFGKHVCDEECDGPKGCYRAKAEKGRLRRIRKAKELCRTCPVINECLRWAIDTRQPYGIWGGTTERERRELQKKGGLRG